MTIKCALLSVSDKTGIVEFAQFLNQQKVKILSTGGTAKQLRQAGIEVSDVADFTESAEMLHGRVKTLHPRIHGGILARRKQDRDEINKHHLEMIDLVVVNLYPFKQAIANPNCDFANAIENIDIGGPTMIRAAAKNHKDVTVVVEPDDYQLLMKQWDTIDSNLRFNLAKKAFAHTADYDAAISNYLGTLDEQYHPNDFPDVLTVQFREKQNLRYGENPHQQAAFYREYPKKSGNIANAKQLQGKSLSYNNIADADAALETVKSFDANSHCCVIVKHANPCGIASRVSQLEAYQRAFATDPTSSFGGIIAFNQVLSAKTAQAIIENQFVEVIIAPEISADASNLLAQKKNVRVLATGPWHQSSSHLDYHRVNGGLLVQEDDAHQIAKEQCKVVTKTTPTPNQMNDLLFAWHAVKHVKSNAIVYAKDLATIGIGAGQMSRVYSTVIAAIKARDEGLTIQGSVMASDAFFPFRDAIDKAAEAGISAIIQPGGSIRDEEIITAANEAGIAMVFTGIRHFNH